MNKLYFHLVAFDIGLYYAWKKYFDDIEEVRISDGNILSFKADAIVSPANSFGYMDGGLDLKYSEYFGWDLERKLRDILEKEYFGEIPVGQAVVIETGNKNIKYLISAPTMRVPMNVEKTVNAYLAFKGVIQAVLAFNKSRQCQKISSILCSGLGTGEGKMSYEQCAYQMNRAYRVCIYGEFLTQGGLAEAVRDQMELVNDAKT
jgi:O-acetyl-ADP-ribose deacetylase (regulator of RNase III)